MDPVKLQDVDCKIAWGSWSEWSECQEYGIRWRFLRKTQTAHRYN